MALSTPTAVVLELMTMGQQSAAHLRELLMAASPPMAAEHGQALTAEILRCCDRVIAAISKGATGAGKKRKVADRGAATCPSDLPLMSSKRRARGTAAHRVLETGTAADGFEWRKYGQKDINGSKHPRFYYRCAYSGEGCGATRRVQQSRDEPAAFVISYYGEHTCADACQQGARSAMPPAVVDSALNAWGGAVGVDSNGGSRGQWSSSSSSEGSSPVLEFLEGGLGVGWESVVNYLG
uniref:Uncharacterized protein n=1 Tax=Avena sativa TaxID=4498 RepID=A0ACD5W287_AVESA